MKHPLLSLLARLNADRRGLTALEFGFVALPLTMFLFGVVELSMAIRTKSALQYATTQAARCAVVDAALCGTDANVQAFAVTKSMGVAVTAASFTVSTQPCGRRVTASVAFPVVAHAVFPVGMTLAAQSCYPI